MALIDKTTIARYRQISKSVRDEKIDPHIDDAEFLDLKPLLGDQFYFELLDKVTASDPLYTTRLMSPYTYTYEGKKYRHMGIERVHSLFSYARYKIDSSTDTPFGSVDKRFTDGVASTPAALRDIYKKNRQEASQYFNDIIIYLNRHRESYPLWGSDCGSSGYTGGVRITKITKS